MNIKRIRAEIQHGFIIGRNLDLFDLSGVRPTGFHLTWHSMSTKPEKWDVCNCYFFNGIQFSYLDFGYRDVLGSALSLSWSFEPVLWYSNRWSVLLNSGIGASYLTKKFDPEKNPLNNFFGTHISFLLHLSPAVEYRFHDSWSARLSANYNHISNGGMKEPNRGKNYPQAGIGLNYYLSRQELVRPEKTFAGRYLSYWVESGFATRRTPEEDLVKLALAANGGTILHVSAINGMGAGAEINLDFSRQNNHGNYGAAVMGPFLSHHFILGQFDFNQRAVWYMVSPDGYSSHSWYQRYVLTYKLKSGFRAGFSLKAHRHVASNIDLRFGWSF